MRERTFDTVITSGTVIVVLGLASFLLGIVLSLLKVKYAQEFLWGGLGILTVVSIVLIVFCMLHLKHKLNAAKRVNGKILATYKSVTRYRCDLDHGSDTPGTCLRCGLPVYESHDSASTKA